MNSSIEFRNQNNSLLGTDPKKLGFAMPGEFSLHEATWVTWPQNSLDWPGKIDAVRLAYCHIIRKLSEHETVRIIVDSSRVESITKDFIIKVGGSLEKIEFFKFPTNRSWIRDNGPIFLKKRGPDSGLAISRFHFNGWGLYPEYEKDDQIPELIGNSLSVQLFKPMCLNGKVFLEGGSLDVNGEGTVLVAETCMVDTGMQVRNPKMGKSEAEEILKNYFGISNVLWVRGVLEGDETFGHVDNLCRFINSNTVVASRERNQKDVNYRALEENWERLNGMCLQDGSKMEVVPLPMPDPLYFNGDRLPASYSNFYIANEIVLCPTFNDKKDRVALGILQELFPTRVVVGIHCVDLVLGGGTIHCITQQQPTK